MMLQTQLLQTFEVYSSRLFFLGHLSTSPKNIFFQGRKSVQGGKVDPFHSAVELGDLFFCLSAGDGFNLPSAISDQTNGGMENFYTTEKFTNRYQT